MIKYLSNENFDEELKGKTILVDFYADWCGPCKMMGSVLETINSIDILKVNVDEHNEIARRFGIMSIPTIMIFKDGQEATKVVGYRNQDELEQLIKENK
jgi:thioredoxin 1